MAIFKLRSLEVRFGRVLLLLAIVMFLAVVGLIVKSPAEPPDYGLFAGMKYREVRETLGEPTFIVRTVDSRVYWNYRREPDLALRFVEGELQSAFITSGPNTKVGDLLNP